MRIAGIILAATLLTGTGSLGQEPLAMNVMSFDGKNGYVELPQNLFDNLSEGTIETWAKWEKFAKWSRVFDFGHENNAFVVQTEKDKNSVNYRIWEGKRRDHKIQANKKLKKGAWHHIAAVFGRSGMALYLDGQLIGTKGFEGGLDTAPGGNNYIGKSNWPKDKLFRGQMAEFRVWNRRLSPAEIVKFKDRTLVGDEQGLVGYWRLGDVNGSEVPSALAGGYPGRAVGDIGVRTIPAISRFLVAGQLEVAAQAMYDQADAAFTAGSFEEATVKFSEVVDLVSGFQDAADRMAQAQQQWDLAEAEKAYTEAGEYESSGQAGRAYEAYGRVLAKVSDYKDAITKREQALKDARFEVGLFVMLSDKVRESLTPQAENVGGRFSRMVSSIGKLARVGLLKQKRVMDEQQAYAYRIMEEGLDRHRAPYISLRRRGDMRRLIEQSGANASMAHYDQVVEAAKGAGLPVLVLAEFTEAYTTTKKRESNQVFWTTKQVEYTDDKGKKRKKDVEDKSYATKRYWVDTEMSCRLNYRILNTATGAIIGEGAFDAEDGDAVDYIAWNKHDGIEPGKLRVKDATKFKRLSSDVRNAIDARTGVKSAEEMFRGGAARIGEQLSARLLEALTYYSPGQ